MKRTFQQASGSNQCDWQPCFRQMRDMLGEVPMLMCQQINVAQLKALNTGLVACQLLADKLIPCRVINRWLEQDVQ